jgi:pimeloyl-ACP methyl ester carboxylesterase
MPDAFTFAIGDETLVGHLYKPAGAVRAIAVLTGPLTSVKEQATGQWAKALSANGIAAIAFDHRYFGQSGGLPRQLENPEAKIADIRAALAALREKTSWGGLPALAVGICAGAGYMAQCVAREPGFRAFIAIAGYYSEVTLADRETMTPMRERALHAQRRWELTGVAETIPAVGPDNGDVAMPLSEAYAYYGTSRGAVPNYTNGFAVQSRVHTLDFDALSAAKNIEVPTLLIHSERALAPSLARRFQGDLNDVTAKWLASQGQIDFYDDPALIQEGIGHMQKFLTVQEI